MIHNEEYDLEMKLTKVYKECEEINWEKLIDYQEKYICKGAVLEIPKFTKDEKVTQLMFFESSEEDCSLSLVIITGRKAGTVWVHLPKEGYYEGTRVISSQWMFENFKTWIAPHIDINQVKFLYNDCCPRSRI